MGVRNGIVCLKRTVIAVNFILWFLGICMLAYSLWLFFDSGNPRTPEHLDQNLIVISDLSPYYAGVFILMGASFLMTVVGLLGWIGAYKESPGMLVAYAGIIAAVSSGQMAAGAIVIANQSQILTGLSNGLLDIVQTKYSSSSYYTESQLLDYLQQRYNCCGNANYEDWHNSYWESADSRRLIQQLVPGSCCFGIVASETTCSIASTIGGWNPYLFKTGCGTKLLGIFNANIYVITCVGIVLAGIELLAAAASIHLCFRLRKEERRLY